MVHQPALRQRAAPASSWRNRRHAGSARVAPAIRDGAAPAATATAPPPPSSSPCCHHRTSKACRSVAAQSSRRDALSGLALLSAASLAAQQPGAAAAAPAPPPPPKPFCAVVDIVPSWAYNTPWQEDLVPFAGGNTWYRWVNYVPPPGSGGLFTSLQRRYSPAAPDKLPLLVVAGGPGFSCSYLEPLELMAGVGRQVIFYDQVGCGNTFLASDSSAPPRDALTLELCLQQIDALRAALKLERCHLYGQGSGGMLALAYAASRGGAGSSGVASVAVGSVAPSYEQLLRDRREAARRLLGGDGVAVLLDADAADAAAGGGLRRQPEWWQYERQYVCRSPAAMAAASGCVARVEQQQSRPVLAALAGGRYFGAAGGALDGWSVAGLDAAALQDTLVLVARGEHDEVSPSSAQQLADALPSSGGRVFTFEGSGSFMHIDAWEPHLTRVEQHLCQAEGSELPTAAGA